MYFRFCREISGDRRRIAHRREPHQVPVDPNGARVAPVDDLKVATPNTLYSTAVIDCFNKLFFHRKHRKQPTGRSSMETERFAMI